MRNSVIRVAIVAAVALVLAFVILRALSLTGDLSGIPTVERPWLIALALALYAATLLSLGLVWRQIVCRLDQKRPPLVDSLAVFCASWLGRYVPSGLPYVAGKLVMGARLGHRTSSLAASMVYENAVVVSIGVMSSSVVLPLTLVGGAGPAVYLGVGLGGVAGMLVLLPPVFYRLANAATRLAGRQAIVRERLLSYRDVATVSAFAAFALVLNGAFFAVALSAFVDLSARELVASAAIYNLAGVAGIAALPVPSGLGVREAVLIGLLQLYVSPEVAIAAALLARLGGLGVDVALGLAGAGLVAWRQRRIDVSPSERLLEAA